MKPSLLLALSLLCPFSLLLAEEADQFSDYQFRRSLTPATSREGVASVPLDDGFFGPTRADFGDVRLLKKSDEGFVEWPFLVKRDEEGPVKVPSRKIPSETISFIPGDGGVVEIVVELKKGEMNADSLEIRSPLRDFEKKITVAGSNDGESWQPLVRNRLIFDREQFLDFRRTKIELPGNEYRFFRLQISEATDEQRSAVRQVTRSVGDVSGTTVEESSQIRTRPFRVDEIAFYTAKEEHEPGRGESDYVVSVEQVIENAEEKQTEVILTTGRSPLRELRLETEDKNFRRSIRVEIPRSKGSEEWKTIHRGAVHRYEVGDLSDESVAIRFNETRSEQMRVVIENGDNPPIAVTGFAGSGAVYRLQFLAEAGEEWELVYGADEGAEDLAKPAYDVAALERALAEGVSIESLELGPEERNTAYVVAGSSPFDWLGQGWVLKLAIAAVVAVLIWVLVAAARQVEEKEAES